MLFVVGGGVIADVAVWTGENVGAGRIGKFC
jgi:hypothetical protein